MQANDIHSGYDDRDAYEMAQFIKAQRAWRRSLTSLIIEDVETGRKIESDGGLAFMLKAYLSWAKELIGGTKKEGSPFHFRLTLKSGDGTILRTSDFKRG